MQAAKELSDAGIVELALKCEDAGLVFVAGGPNSSKPEDWYAATLPWPPSELAVAWSRPVSEVRAGPWAAGEETVRPVQSMCDLRG